MNFNKTTLDILYGDMDRIIDDTMKEMDYGTRDHISELITLAVNKISPDKKDWRTGFIQDVMVEKGLIELDGSDERGQITKLTTRGVLIKKAGGWMSHLRQKRNKERTNDFIKWTTLVSALIGAIAAITSGICTTTNTTDKYSESQSEKLIYQDSTRKATKTDSLQFQKMDSVTNAKAK